MNTWEVRLPAVHVGASFFEALRLVRARWSWQDDARCANTDTESFYPQKGGSAHQARRLCQGCPVRSECLEAALELRDEHGFWGGLSPQQREGILRERDKQREGEAA